MIVLDLIYMFLIIAGVFIFFKALQVFVRECEKNYPDEWKVTYSLVIIVFIGIGLITTLITFIVTNWGTLIAESFMNFIYTEI